MIEENLSTADNYNDKDKSYDLFILALSLLSLITIAIMAIPFARPEAKEVAYFVDTLICVVFLFDSTVE